MPSLWRLIETSFPGLDQLRGIYLDLDVKIAAMQAATGLHCPKFCKKCCDIASDRIQVTPLEVLPLSIHWWRTGQAQHWIEELSQVTKNDPCLLFQTADPKAWGCGFYPWRPLLCRMFCFCAALDKTGNPEFGLCAPLQSHNPNWKSTLTNRIPKGFPVPIYRDFAERIAGLNPSLSRPYPINQALLRGLEIVGLKLQFVSESGRQYKKTS